MGSDFGTLDHSSGAIAASMHHMMAIDQVLTSAVLILAGLAAVVFVLEIVLKKSMFGKIGYGLMALAALSNFGELATRYSYMVKISPDYWPLSNLFESVMYIVVAIFAIYLVVDRMFKAPGFGLVSSFLVAIIIGLASLLPPRLKDAHPLVPSLQSYWLKVHVSLMLISYAAFFLSFVGAILYLFFHYRDRLIAPRAVGAMAAKGAKASVATLAMLDELTYRMVLLGFPLLAFGIILGGMWANHAWGTYWSWDPKETWSLITWLFYAAYLHVRLQREWRGTKAAWFAVLCFASLLVTYLGVNYLATGLHTYGKLF